MKTLLVIIALHVLVIIRAKTSDSEIPPYFSVAFITLILTGFVLYMMFTMEQPVP